MSKINVSNILCSNLFTIIRIRFIFKTKKVTRGNSNYLAVNIKFWIRFWHILLDIDEIYLKILIVFLIHSIFCLNISLTELRRENRIAPGHLTIILKLDGIQKPKTRILVKKKILDLKIYRRSYFAKNLRLRSEI